MKRLLIFIFVIALACSCDKSNNSSLPTTPAMQNEAEMRQEFRKKQKLYWDSIKYAEDDDERWRIYIREFKKTARPDLADIESAAMDNARENILSYLESMENYLDNFPGIFKYLEFKKSDIHYLAEVLDQAGRIPKMSIVAGLSANDARRLLFVLTGQEFASKQEVLDWLDHHPDLKWDHDQGRFVAP